MPEYRSTAKKGKMKPRIACQNITTLTCVYCNLLLRTFMAALKTLAHTMIIVPAIIDGYPPFSPSTSTYGG